MTSVYWNNPGRGQAQFDGPQVLTRAVKYLLISNVVVYLIQQLAGFGLVRLFGLIPVDVLQKLAVHQLVTYMFLHGGFFHILMNMFILWMFGREIESVWGTKGFLRYYFLCGIAGGIFTVLFMPNSTVPTVGASGAIYGLLVAYAVMFPNRTIYLYFLFPVKVKWAVIGFVILEFLASFSAANSTVGHLAHLGGAVVGFVFLKLDWRIRKLFNILSPRWWLREARMLRAAKKMAVNRQKTEDIMKKVDEILDKINEVGIENLSAEERRFLGSASDILSKKDK